MRVKKAPPHGRRSVAPALTLVLAAVCLVQTHLLLRPRGSGAQEAANSAGALQSSSEGSSLFATEQQRQQWRQQQQQQHWQQQQQQQQRASGGGGGGGGAAGMEGVRGAPVAFVSFANGAFNDFIANWVLSVQRLGVPFLVGALDKDMAATAAAAGWPHLDVSALVASNSSFFRANFATFRNMGATKVQLVLTMLEEFGVGTVVVSDSDTAWLRNPAEYFEQHPTADWYISTDCLSHETEVAWKPGHNQPRCGHVPGNGWGRAFNTGVFAVRNRPASKKVLGLWRDVLLDPERATVITKTNVTLGITDQLALNLLLEDGKVTALHASAEDPRVLSLRNGTLRLHPLPALHFPSGHVAFVQRLPWRYGVDPYVVHATFQRFATQLHRVGKRGRFREFGMWFLDPPEYYAPPGGGRYLTYDNNVRSVVASLALPQFPEGLPLLYRHMAAVSYQLAAFRDALAISRMLNRTLVLPKAWCWCDYDWTPHVLEKCKIRGSDLAPPFECPSDFVFHIPFMEGTLEGGVFRDEKHVDFRMPGFLEMLQVPEHVRRWRAEVQVLASAPPQLELLGGEVGAARAAAIAAPTPANVLWPAMAQSDLLKSLQQLNATAVLSLRGMQPGVVRGFSSRAEQAAFDALYDKITKELYWCCAAEGNLKWASFLYERPKPFGGGYARWRPPTLAVPDWCDQQLGPPKLVENTEYVHYANHPCQFLRNATAAALAASYATE